MAFNLGRALDAAGGQDARTASLYKQAADHGHLAAMVNFGRDLELGKGVTRDLAGAVSYYRRAAEKGQIIAAANLAVCLETGKGVARDYGEAAKWYQVAADGGHAPAMTALGYFYILGSGVTADWTKAAALFEQARAAGDVSALNGLGWMYELGGPGVARDLARAASYYKQAADAGDPTGMSKYGGCLANGTGVPADEAAGLALVMKANEAGNGFAAYLLGSWYGLGKHVPKDVRVASGYLLDSLRHFTADAERALITERGNALPPDLLAALQDEMQARGLQFERKTGEFSDTAIAALQNYALGM
jgi:TPR repeat protein